MLYTLTVLQLKSIYLFGQVTFIALVDSKSLYRSNLSIINTPITVQVVYVQINNNTTLHKAFLS